MISENINVVYLVNNKSKIIENSCSKDGYVYFCRSKLIFLLSNLKFLKSVSNKFQKIRTYLIVTSQKLLKILYSNAKFRMAMCILYKQMIFIDVKLYHTRCRILTNFCGDLILLDNLKIIE